MAHDGGDTIPPGDGDRGRAERAALTLLAARAPGATICPSEVARAIASHDGAAAAGWRSAMPTVHAAIDRLVADGLVALSWKGRRLPARSGPYRFGRRDE